MLLYRVVELSKQAQKEPIKQYLTDVRPTAYESNEKVFEKIKENNWIGELFSQIFAR